VIWIATFLFGAIVMAFSVVFLAVAGTRLIIEVLPGGPDHAMWTGLGYILSSLALLIVTGLMMWRVSR
jgi:hypothetical protein